MAAQLIVECQTNDIEVSGSNPTMVQCCVLKKDTLSSLLSTGSTQENVHDMTEKLLTGTYSIISLEKNSNKIMNPYE